MAARALVFFGCCAGLPHVVAAQLVDCHVYVREGGAAELADGTSWETAFGEIQTALTAIGKPAAATNVCLAAGVYHPSVPLELRDNIHLYGGFVGFESSTYDLRDRDLATNATVLDGAARVDHVLKCGSIQCAGPILIDGITVRGGAAGRHGASSFSGGGLYNAIGEITLSNVVFADNEAEHQGGAVFNVAGTLTLSNVVVDGNSATHEGGGIYNHAGKLSLWNVVFVDNASDLGGAGVYTLGATDISNAIFLNNKAPYGSAAVAGHWFNLTNSIVWSNRAAQGPQIFVNPALAKVAYSIVEDNVATNNVAYVGVSNTGEDPLFVDVADPDGADDRWGTDDDGLMLREDSPAIDAGTREGVTLADRDLVGNPRIFGRSVDTGPYEFDPSGSVVTSTGDDELVDGFVLRQNYPNPFNPVTQITFSLPSAEHVRLVVYDLLGHQIDVLLDGGLPAGSHESSFDATRLPSGVYSYVLDAGGRVLQGRMVLAK